MMISFRQKSGFEVVLQNACHGPRTILTAFALRMRLLTTPSIPSVIVLPIIFVMLLKNAQMLVQLCEITPQGNPVPPGR
jgi:hypothetical protein